MAKCRECGGQGFIVHGLMEEGGPICETCNGRGEVSEAPSHFATGALPPVGMGWMEDRTVGEIEAINTLFVCLKHLRIEGNTYLVTRIEETLRTLEVPVPDHLD